MDLLGLLAGGLFNAFANQGATQQAQQASAAQSNALNTENQILQYGLNRRKNVYDPIIDNAVIPQLMNRATSAPFFAGDALNFTRQLRKPMNLNY